jgi:Family of unknown function (DUF6328)
MHRSAFFALPRGAAAMDPREEEEEAPGKRGSSAGRGARSGREHCEVCTSQDGHDSWNARARGESPLQRADRAYGEILQEVRVAQTGVQILFAFLLTLAFTARFKSVTPFQRDIYVLTLMLCALATALLIAPAACHRVVYRRRLKQHLVRVANRLALAGLMLLLLAMVSALLLILDVVIGLGPSLFLAAGALVWFVTWWFVLPLLSRIRHEAVTEPLDDPAGSRTPPEMCNACLQAAAGSSDVGSYSLRAR